MNSLDRFLRAAPPIDDHREDAALCCEETAKHERGERPPLRLDPNDIEHNEFSDAVAGISAELVMLALEATKTARVLVHPAVCWDIAAKLLRSGWQRGDLIHPIFVDNMPRIFCGAKTSRPCRRRQWHAGTRSYKPVIGRRVRVPHMSRAAP